MAVTCARCGTQNPDGNRFCNSCGTPLVPSTAQAPAVPVGAAAGAPPTWIPPAPAAPAAPPPGYAAPVYAPPQPAYQSPYYVPAPGQQGPAVHRTPWVLIISIIVAMVLVLSGIGTVLALTLGHKTSTGSSTFGSVSTPSPASSPGESPQPSPSSQPTQASGGQTVANDAESVLVPAGWTVLNKDADSISLQSPDGDGTLTVASGPFSPPETAQQIKDEIDKELAAKYPDAGSCPGSGTSQGALAGVNGIFWTECFTLSSGGQSVPVGEPLWAGANSKGSVGYVLVLETTQDNLDNFIKECSPILENGITWKLK